jgi:phosphatidylglycerol:prolipoprotein diacylglycerol transferase
MVPLAMTAENKAAMKKLDGPIAFAGRDTQLPASASRKEFVEKTEAYNAKVKQKLEEQQKNH